MGRPTRQAAKAKDNAVETAAHRFLELLADRLREGTGRTYDAVQPLIALHILMLGLPIR